MRLALSRSRELLADAGAVELTKNPDAMISALRKIENRGELPGATSAVMEMCIDNPREGFADLFATHPSVDSRVAALVRYAGGHDSGRLALPTDADLPDDDRALPDTSRPLPAQPAAAARTIERPQSIGRQRAGAVGEARPPLGSPLTPFRCCRAGSGPISHRPDRLSCINEFPRFPDAEALRN